MKKTQINNNQDCSIPAHSTISIGTYQFINCIPLNVIFENDSNGRLSPVKGTPAEINKLLLNNNLLLGPISSVDYIQNKEKFILLNNISISSQQDVGSVILFSNKEFHDLNNAKIAISTASSTSVMLLKLLLKINNLSDVYFCKHNYEKPLPELLKDYDACLYIGDPALISLNKENTDNIFTYDLAKQWFEKTNLPFVFCVWVANKQWGLEHLSLVEFINQMLIQSKQQAENNQFQEAIIKSSQLSNLNSKILLKYYHKQLSYNFTEKHHEALDLFETLLKKYNIL